MLISKEKIREVVLDHWMPERVIDEIQFYIGRFGKNLPEMEANFTYLYHHDSAAAWLGASLLHRERRVLDAVQTALDNGEVGGNVRYALGEAYETWFIETYKKVIEHDQTR